MLNALRRLALLATLFALPALAEDLPTPPPVENQDILPYLEQVISWQRDMLGLEPTPGLGREALVQDALRKNARKAVQGAVAFSREEAELLAVEPEKAADAPDAPTDRQSRLQQSLAQNAARVASIKTQLAVLAKTPARTATQRALIEAKRAKLNEGMQLLLAQQGLLGKVTGIFREDEKGRRALLDQIDNLARSLPEAATEAPKPATSTTASGMSAMAMLSPIPLPVAVATKEEKSDTDGIVGLIGGMYNLSRKQQDVEVLTEHTKDLQTATVSLIDRMRGQLRAALTEGDRLTNADAADANAAVQQRQAITAITTRYKSLSAAIIPLGQVRLSLETGAKALADWKTIINQDFAGLLKRLIFRLGLLAIMLAIPFVISELARRATNRYVQDPKRQRQLRIFRRIIFVTLLVLILILNFVTEFGSLATFAGFLTAGLAVALQTVLLSLVAHFFFFGRFGVRTGDRLTIAGTTGDVIQVGMLRLYMMELVGSEGDWRPSGRIVAFPNSILFNPTAFSKQIPGTSYDWNRLTFLLDPDSDYQLAHTKIMEQVNAVYGEYQEDMRTQHAMLEQSTRLTVKLPEPKGEISFTDKGLALDLRYPVIRKQASTVQERLLRRIIDAFKSEPTLELVLSNPMKVQGVRAAIPAPPHLAPLP